MELDYKMVSRDDGSSTPGVFLQGKSTIYRWIVNKPKPKKNIDKRNKKAFYLGLKTNRQLKNMGMGNLISGPK